MKIELAIRPTKARKTAYEFDAEISPEDLKKAPDPRSYIRARINDLAEGLLHLAHANGDVK